MAAALIGQAGIKGFFQHLAGRLDRHDRAQRRPVEALATGEFGPRTAPRPPPFAEIGRRLDCTEAEVLAAFERLQEAGVISRLGAVVAPNRAGRSTLAAMTVPPDRLAAVAARINRFPAVNHN